MRSRKRLFAMVGVIALSIHSAACTDELPNEPDPRPEPVVQVDVVESGVISMSTSVYGHACAVTGEGGLVCWGPNLHGKLGIGSADGDGVNAHPPTPVLIPDGESFRVVATGHHHTCALSAAGEVYCWGGNGAGQLGTGDDQEQHAPVLVSAPGGVRFEKVVAGAEHTCAFSVDGEVYCWGSGRSGALGTGSRSDARVPTRVEGLEGADIVDLAAGDEHTCAVTAAGEAYCWGSNTRGQLADGGEIAPCDGREGGSCGGRDSLVPQPVQRSGNTEFIRIGAAAESTCALTREGWVFCWGASYSGESHSVARGVTPGRGGFRGFAVGYDHGCAVNGAGELHCWGSNRSGQFGTGRTSLGSRMAVRAGPQIRLREVAAGREATCAVTDEDDQIVCWGHRWAGQLGDSVKGHADAPVALDLGTVRQLDSSHFHTCAVTENLSVYCWGENGPHHRITNDWNYWPFSEPTPVWSGVLYAARSVATGLDHTCALMWDGPTYCWGYGADGRLGYGEAASSSRPRRVASPEGVSFTELSVSLVSCALGSDGRVYCWGPNRDGLLGQGAPGLDMAVEPTPVRSGPDVRYAALSVGERHVCAVSTEGEVHCWGSNRSGQLGTGDRTDRDVPTPVAVGTTFRDVAAGETHTCAIAESGEAYCWGEGYEGALGTGDDIERLAPAPVVGGHTFKSLSAGVGFTCGITTDDAALCWGANSNWQYGNRGWPVSGNVPAPAASGIRLASIATGRGFACGVTADGAAYCWGSRQSGRLGDGKAEIQLEVQEVFRR